MEEPRQIGPEEMFTLFAAARQPMAEASEMELLPDRAIVQLVYRRMQGEVKVGEMALPQPLVLCEAVEDGRTISLGEMLDRAIAEHLEPVEIEDGGR